MSELLMVRNLSVDYIVDEGIVKAVESVSFKIFRNEKVALIGETGCGKSTVALAIIRLLPLNSRVRGEVIFENKNLLELSEKEIRQIRGRRISMIFQDPFTALNPLLTIKVQNTEPYEIHLNLKREKAIKMAINMLNKVRIPNPEESIDRYPHTFSGGMRQRILTAMMMSLHPDLLIADEPFSSLDVTIQAGIIQILNELIESFNSSLLLITHDLGVVAETCDRVIVMYAGKNVEMADVYTIFENPMHPYTRGLLSSIPRLDIKVKRLPVLAGSPPNLLNPPTGCRFHPRCPRAMDICKRVSPPLIEVNRNHLVACHLYSDGGESGTG